MKINYYGKLCEATCKQTSEVFILVNITTIDKKMLQLNNLIR